MSIDLAVELFLGGDGALFLIVRDHSRRRLGNLPLGNINLTRQGGRIDVDGLTLDVFENETAVADVDDDVVAGLLSSVLGAVDDVNGIGRLISDDGIFTVAVSVANDLLDAAQLDLVIAHAAVDDDAAAVTDDGIIAQLAEEPCVDPDVGVVDDEVIARAALDRDIGLFKKDIIIVGVTGHQAVIGLDGISGDGGACIDDIELGALRVLERDLIGADDEHDIIAAVQS